MRVALRASHVSLKEVYPPKKLELLSQQHNIPIRTQIMAFLTSVGDRDNEVSTVVSTSNQCGTANGAVFGDETSLLGIDVHEPFLGNSESEIFFERDVLQASMEEDDEENDKHYRHRGWHSTGNVASASRISGAANERSLR
jgi:hypothetical protein